MPAASAGPRAVRGRCPLEFSPCQRQAPARRAVRGRCPLEFSPCQRQARARRAVRGRCPLEFSPCQRQALARRAVRGRCPLEFSPCQRQALARRAVRGRCPLEFSPCQRQALARRAVRGRCPLEFRDVRRSFLLRPSNHVTVGLAPAKATQTPRSHASSCLTRTSPAPLSPGARMRPLACGPAHARAAKGLTPKSRLNDLRPSGDARRSITERSRARCRPPVRSG